jgi:hypothetical protein
MIFCSPDGSARGARVKVVEVVGYILPTWFQPTQVFFSLAFFWGWGLIDLEILKSHPGHFFSQAFSRFWGFRENNL